VSGPIRKRISQVGFVFFAILLIFGCFTPFSRSFFGLPVYQNVLVGEPIAPSLQVPGSLKSVLYWESDRPEAVRMPNAGGSPVIGEAGEYRLSLKLFGLVPLRHLTVSAVPEIKVVPGGQSIGVLLHSRGVMVIGAAPLENGEREYSPAYQSGIREGDVILSINGREVQCEADVREIVNEAGAQHGRKLAVRLKRNGVEFLVGVTPDYCERTGRYRVGLMVRDSAAGVGTMTFYEPATGAYGALGHVITDGRSPQRLELTDGRIVEAAIHRVHPGMRGRPGEKLGAFAGEGSFTGTIDQNTTCGIFGTLEGKTYNQYFREPIPVALLHHVRPGPAEMLTVLHDRQIERFDLMIEEVRPESGDDGKGLVIRIDDERLLERSGGIIQGMSGSPIIQNGRLVGAVTHVFVNNPSRGYGAPVEWMLRESGLLKKPESARWRKAG